jgi:hypothetical protein
VYVHRVYLHYLPFVELLPFSANVNPTPLQALHVESTRAPAHFCTEIPVAMAALRCNAAAAVGVRHVGVEKVAAPAPRLGVSGHGVCSSPRSLRPYTALHGLPRGLLRSRDPLTSCLYLALPVAHILTELHRARLQLRRCRV